MEDIVAATAAVPIVVATVAVPIVAATVPVGTVQAVTVPVAIVILPATTKIPGGSTRFGRV
jgi:hypothetical protein